MKPIPQWLKIADAAATEIREALAKNDLFVADVSPAYTSHNHALMPCVEVTIEWGDWKHDHLRCDYICKTLGYALLREEQTEDSDCDCYSAIRYYTAVK